MVRIAGRFKGDVQVDGNVSLDAGARLEGQVKAHVVSVGGELIGNIDNAKRVELLETGVINGDVKAGSLTVGAGSRMRGQVEFGYEGESRAKSDTKGFGNAMNVASRPVAAGKTRTCPHCKATILESLSICPGCLHHLRFDQRRRSARSRPPQRCVWRG